MASTGQSPPTDLSHPKFLEPECGRINRLKGNNVFGPITQPKVATMLFDSEQQLIRHLGNDKEFRAASSAHSELARTLLPKVSLIFFVDTRKKIIHDVHVAIRKDRLQKENALAALEQMFSEHREAIAQMDQQSSKENGGRFRSMSENCMNIRIPKFMLEK